MSNTPSDPRADASREETLSELFAAMVMQQTNMALIFLGRAPHPDRGEPVRDLDAAQMFIDQLEMLEVKTKGNLSPEEARLLKQSLMNLRMAFVDAAQQPSAQPSTASSGPPPAQSSARSAGEPPRASAQDEESRKKFS